MQAPEGAKALHAKGMLVMPGGVDRHTHLYLPYMGTNTCDDHFSGQAASRPPAAPRCTSTSRSPSTSTSRRALRHGR
eukprot:352753-Chlamydomonas_euryale.AAC.6